MSRPCFPHPNGDKCRRPENHRGRCVGRDFMWWSAERCALIRSSCRGRHRFSWFEHPIFLTSCCWDGSPHCSPNRLESRIDLTKRIAAMTAELDALKAKLDGYPPESLCEAVTL